MTRVQLFRSRNRERISSETSLSRQNRRLPRSLHGFTLIELLVVVAIIALLVAILVPSLNKARAQAQSVVCKTNLKQIHLAVMYYAEYNSRLYPWSVSGPPNPPGKNWSEAGQTITEYIGRSGMSRKQWGVGHQVMQCPTSTASTLQNDGTEVNHCDYVANCWVMAFRYMVGADPPNRTWRRIGDISRPANIILMADGVEDDGVSDFFTRRPSIWPQHTWESKIGDRHSEGTNLLYVDGHAEWIRFTDIKDDMISE